MFPEAKEKQDLNGMAMTNVQILQQLGNSKKLLASATAVLTVPRSSVEVFSS